VTNPHTSTRASGILSPTARTEECQRRWAFPIRAWSRCNRSMRRCGCMRKNREWRCAKNSSYPPHAADSERNKNGCCEAVAEATVQGIRVCFRAQADEKIDVSQVRKQYQQDQLRQKYWPQAVARRLFKRAVRSMKVQNPAKPVCLLGSHGTSESGFRRRRRSAFS